IRGNQTGSGQQAEKALENPFQNHFCGKLKNWGLVFVAQLKACFCLSKLKSPGYRWCFQSRHMLC
ncbi:unnamed protein product, partial [Prunus brigantina]